MVALSVLSLGIKTLPIYRSLVCQNCSYLRNVEINVSTKGLDALYKASARGAAYNSAERHPSPRCAEGTREEIRAAIIQWISNPDDRPVFWLSGLAGSGKSAIAQTISEFCAKHNMLAASFFFSRGNVERSTSRHLFTTIAYQLTISTPELKIPIQQTLHNDPSIPDRIIHDQLQCLIVDPILSLNESSTPGRVIVIDALDECNDPRTIQDIIVLLANTLRQHRSLFRVIVTSRPEIHIQSQFRDPQVDSLTRHLALHNFDADGDIRIFLALRFKEIYKDHGDVMHNTPHPWPSDRDLEQLVRESSGLFIFAATIINFIDSRYDLPHDRLKVALQGNNPSRFGSSPHAGLDELYRQVLSTTTLYVDRLRLVLGTIILLFDPLSVESIGLLLHIGSEYVRLALRPLYSVLLIPDENFHPVRTLHQSLHEFLTDSQRSGIYFIDPAQLHTYITRHCLKLMTTALKRDICHIADSSKLNSEVIDLPQKSNVYIGEALRYACRYWADHLRFSDASDSYLLSDLRTFAFDSMLYWIETLSILGHLRIAIPSLQQSRIWLQVSGFRCLCQYRPHHACYLFQKICSNTPPDLTEILHDGERFVLTFFDIITASALQVYYSALPFTPTGTCLRRVYSSHVKTSIQVVTGLAEQWDSCLRTIPCPSDMISIAFSRNGAYLASGSNRGTLHIWDAVTGVAIASKEGQLSFVHSVTFSPHNSFLAFGCYPDPLGTDAVVSLWDIATGHLCILGHHQAAITTVAFSPNGDQIASMSRDGVIMLWDVAESRLLSMFCGYRALSFCPDSGALLLFKDSDGALVLWNMFTGESEIVTCNGTMDSVCPIMASTNVPWVASRPRSGSNLSIWNFHSGTHQLQCTLDRSENIQWPPLLVLSPTALTIACAAEPSVQLWSVVTGQRLPDIGHGMALAHSAFEFSSDGAHIASFHRHNKVIQLWDAPAGLIDEVFSTASSRLSDQVSQAIPRSDAILLSPNYIISYSTDDVKVRLWDVNTGQFLCTCGSASHGWLLAISMDGSHLAWLNEQNMTIEIWDVAANTLLTMINPCYHDNSDLMTVHQAVFSGAGKYMVIHSSWMDNHWTRWTSLELWDTETGHNHQTLFSTDDHQLYHGTWTIICSHTEARVASLNADYGGFWLWDASGAVMARGSIQSTLASTPSIGEGGFSSDDSLAAFVYPNFISLWDTNNGQCLVTLSTTKQKLFPLPWPMSLGFYTVGTHVYVVSAAGSTHIPSHFISSWSSAIHTSSQHHFYMDHDGWIFDGMERVCWVPTEYRPGTTIWWPRQASQGHRLVVVTAQHRFVVFDFTGFCDPCPYKH